MDTYLNAEAMLNRINNMQTQAQTVYKSIENTRDVMEQLKNSFGGNSATELQKKYNELADTFQDVLKYLQDKADFMQTLTTNIKRTDEE